MDDRRKFHRIPFRIRATSDFQGEIFQAEVSDLSMKGMFLATAVQVPIGEILDLVLTLDGTSPPRQVRLKGKVMRLETSGFGVEIAEIELDTFVNLRNMISLNVENPDEVMDDFLK